jgi:hypothetical protein
MAKALHMQDGDSDLALPLAPIHQGTGAQRQILPDMCLDPQRQ